MKRFLYALFFISFSVFSQTVSVNTTTNNTSQLVDLLLDNPCIDPTNESISSSQAVGYFNNNNSNFPIDEGVIIRSGEASFSAGSYTGNNLSSQLNSNSDADLQDINDATGQSSTITDVAFLQFDFVPYAKRLKFKFLLASNEYGEWQCFSTDAMAIILTNLTTGESTNMGVIPGTSTPVAVRNIKDQTYNTSCNSKNPGKFGVFNVDNAASVLNMRGYTKAMKASATVTPGDSYQIRFVVGDGNDADYDSALFLKAGSFRTKLSLGADKTLCEGETINLNTGLDTATYEHTWRRNGTVIFEENGSSLTVTQGGTYEVSVEKNGSSCVITDDIVITDFSAGNPSDMTVCEAPSGYTLDLHEKDAEILAGQDPADLDISYFSSFEDAENNTNSIAPADSYTLASGFSTQTIWVLAKSTSAAGCSDIVSFDITEEPLPLVDDLPNVIECSEYTLPALSNGTYYDSNDQALSAGDVITEPGVYYVKNGPDQYGCVNQSSFRIRLVDHYTVSEFACGTYTVPNLPGGNFYTATDGPNGIGTVIPSGTELTSDQTIYYYAEVNGNVCRNEAFDIVVPPLPPVDSLPDVTYCDEYTLPAITDGDYFTQPDGGGSQLAEGQVLTSTKRVYIFADDGTCTDETSFKVVVIPDYEDIEACGSYELPALQAGSKYFTEPAGNGQEIQGNTVLTTSQTIYVYAHTTEQPNCTDDLSFYVLVKPIPPVDELEDVEIFCEEDFYVLPELTDGQYFTESGRGGASLAEGDTLTTGQTIYLNSELNGCQKETSFEVIENYLPDLIEYTHVYSCDPYELPDPVNGNFYTESGGNGTMLHGGDLIYTTQTLYIYSHAEGANYSCFKENSFNVNILGIPVEEEEDVNACDSYTLPELNAGDYFTESGGEGTALQAGDVIDSTQTIYVYAINGTRFICESEVDFEVNVSETPVLPAFDNLENCGSFTLPALPDEDYDLAYYLSPGGNDEITDEESTFETPGTYTIYVYATATDNLDCSDQAQFQLSIYPIPEMTIEGGTICRDAETGDVLTPVELESGVDSPDFEVNWYLNNQLVHTGANFTAEEAGEYTVKTTKLTPEAGGECNYADASVTVYESSAPTAIVHINEDFADETYIEVEVLQDYGEYLYALDDAGFQANNTFRDLDSGMHTVSIKGLNGDCGVTTLTVHILAYPKFFTPNNDGKNDIWNIPDLKTHREAKIYIHDRFGKLLRVISPSGEGWDGRYHSKALPSNDFWFRVTYKIEGEPREFRSHFTLKR